MVVKLHYSLFYGDRARTLVAARSRGGGGGRSAIHSRSPARRPQSKAQYIAGFHFHPSKNWINGKANLPNLPWIWCALHSFLLFAKGEKEASEKKYKFVPPMFLRCHRKTISNEVSPPLLLFLLPFLLNPGHILTP